MAPRRNSPRPAAEDLPVQYLLFLFQNRRFLGFGLLLTFFASFGTTPMISLFGGEIRAEFGLSHGDFGALYSAANLVAAGGIVWLGRPIDVIDLRLYAALVCALLATAAIAMALAPGMAVLFLAFVGLRVAGPGLLNHTAGTSAVRYFELGRGRALGFTALGQPISEALSPTLIVVPIAAFGWRHSWLGLGVVVALLLVPAVLWLLRGHGDRHRRSLDRLALGAGTAGDDGRQWSRRQVLRDLRFYLIMPAVVVPPALLAGFFFHQVLLVEAKGWSLSWWAASFAGFAAARVGVLLLTGFLIDRYDAIRLLPFYILPLALSLVLLAAFDHPATALAFMVLTGVSSGARTTTVNAVWAEVYGTANLGAIRALVAALIMVAVATAPASFGWLLDLGITMETLALGSIVTSLAAGLLFLIYVTRWDLPPRPR